MSEPTIVDVQNDLAALRREMDGLRARLTAAGPDAPDVGQITRNNLRQNLAEKGTGSGMSVGSIVNQIRAQGNEGTTVNVVNLHAASDLPTDAQVAEKIARLALFVQNPLTLRALRCLVEPHFDNQEMRRMKADIATRLGASETEVEAALTPMLERYEVRWGKDSAGQEYYEWTGNSFPILLLIQG